MSWTVPGSHAKKSTFTGVEFTDGSIWMIGSGESPPKKQIAYNIYTRPDGSTFKRSIAKPYSNEANRENWKATQYFKEYTERVPEAESVIAVMPGIPYSIRPENYKRKPSDEWVNGSVPCTCGAGELQHVTLQYDHGDPSKETKIRYTCDCLQDDANYQESAGKWGEIFTSFEVQRRKSARNIGIDQATVGESAPEVACYTRSL